MNHLFNSLSRAGKGWTFGGIGMDGILAEHPAPFYLYDTDTIGKRFKSLFSFIDYADLKIFYAMKANNNPAVLRYLHKIGAGIDAVSIGEVKLALALGFPAERIIFTANNISDGEMEAADETGVLMNIGSLSRLEKFCRRFPGGECCLRFNPEVVAGEDKKIQTGGKTTKFGILLSDAGKAASICSRSGVRVAGIHKHTGSGISDTGLYLESMGNLLSAALYFDDLDFVDFGGGFKVPYREDEEPVDYAAFGKKIGKVFRDFCKKYGRNLDMYFEPGKYLAAEAGIMVIRVNTLKNNNGRLIAGTDSGFPHLIRPVLYNAYHGIVNLSNPDGRPEYYDICGNICESGDRFAEQRLIPEIREGDYLAVLNAGAYCASMAGTYNLRPVPSELVVENGSCRIGRKGLSPEELAERILSEAGI